MPKRKEETPQKTIRKPSSSNIRSPRSVVRKGDELGKNKVQKTLDQYFSPSPAKTESVAPGTSAHKRRKKLFISEVPPSELIVISDDDSPGVRTMEKYHAKTKNIQHKKRSLSRKGCKISSESLLENSSDALALSRDTTSEPPRTEANDSENVGTSAPVPDECDSEELFVRSPSKSFKKQIVMSSQCTSDENSNDAVLKVIAPNNKPSFLSTKFRKRKSHESSTPQVTSAEKKSKSNDFCVSVDPGRENSDSTCDSVGAECVSEVQVAVPTDENELDEPLPCIRLKSTSQLLSPRLKEAAEQQRATELSCSVKPGSPSVVRQLFKDESDSKQPNGHERRGVSARADSNLAGIAEKQSKSSGTDNVLVEPENASLTANRTGTSVGAKCVSKAPIKSAVATGDNDLSQLFSRSPLLNVEPKTELVGLQPGVETEDGAEHQPATKSSSLKSPSVVRQLFGDGSTSIQANRPTCIVARSDVPVSDISLVADIDWSEPMEAETRFRTPVKQPPVDRKNSDFASPSKLPSAPLSQASKSTPVKATPTKNQGVKQSTTASPGTSRSIPSKAASPNNNLIHSTPSKSPRRRTPGKSPRRTPKKGTPVKTDRDVMGGNTLFIHCIQECHRYAQMAFNFNSRNKKVAEDYLSLHLPEKVVLFKLLMRKWSWIREVDMKYEKIAHNQLNSLSALKDKGFLEDMPPEEELNIILGELKRPELADLCKSFKLDNNGTKTQLADRLYKFACQQGGLGFSASSLKTKMQKTAFLKLGTCVRVSAEPREALQQIFEASMSPLYLEGQFYTFQERLRGMEQLMNGVKFDDKKLVPFHLTDVQLFKTTAQFDEYVTSVKLKFEILAARDRKDNERGIELARDARASLLIYVNSEAVLEFLEKTPRYIWRYTAGSNYTSALDTGIDFFKRAKDYDTAILALDVLLGQGRFRKHCRGHWYAEKALILEKHMKRSTSEVYNVVLKGLQEDLTPLGRLELSRKAESLMNKKKNGLSVEEKEEMKRLMKIPRLRHSVKEIKSTEAPNMGSGTRQTFVEVSATGDRVYSNVEQTARNSYMGDYPEGLHDEGSFLKNIILAAFWPVIYAPQDAVFLSKYQHCPLDWGTYAFYKNRETIIEEHLKLLEERGIDGVMEQITAVVTDYLHHHSLVNWSFVCFDMLPTIKNILTCLTLSKFLLLSKYLLESFRERRSGWPDLTLWNTVTKKFKLVEVKSPNDELSFKQIVWLEKFAEMGIDVEECRVNASNKGKKRKAQATQYSDASQEV